MSFLGFVADGVGAEYLCWDMDGGGGGFEERKSAGVEPFCLR